MGGIIMVNKTKVSNDLSVRGSDILNYFKYFQSTNLWSAEAIKVAVPLLGVLKVWDMTIEGL